MVIFGQPYHSSFMKSYADKSQEQTVHHSQKKSTESQFPLSDSAWADHREEAITQRKLQQIADESPQVQMLSQLQKIADHPPVQEKNDDTGLPRHLKSGIEHLSGYSMDDVKVHYNSAMPIQLQAHAYAQGTDIHLASGQEKHLPHEAWHVVQQKQGRVKPTLQMKGGAQINDDQGLEKEADEMGSRALLYPNIVPVQKKENKRVAMLPGNWIVQRVVTIKGKSSQKYPNLGKFKTSRLYAAIMREFVAMGIDADVITYHLGQLFSQNVDFENEQHFKEALMYDVRHKSARGAALNLQEQYMTEIGWNRRKNGGEVAAPAEDEEGRKLKVYRTMDLEEYEEMRDDPSALRGHLGDFKQAHNYLHRKSSKPKVLVEFTLRPGAERYLFSPAVMAFPHPRHKRKVPDLIRGVLVQEGADNSFAEANPNEGTAPDRIGVKSEGGEAGFSLGIGGGRSPVMFMKMVERMTIIGRSHPEEEQKSHAKGASAVPRPLEEEEHKSSEASSSVTSSSRSGEGEAHAADGVTIDGRHYTVNVAGVRSTGECFWDTLRHYRIAEADIITAAGNAGLTVNKHVLEEAIPAFFTALAAATGQTYHVNLDMINILTLKPAGSRKLSDGAIAINIGFFVNLDDGQGHYVPEV